MELVPVTPAHLEALAATMRSADAAECRALGFTPRAALEESFECSDFAAALVLGNEVAAIGGLYLEASPSPLAASTAQAWLLTGTAVERAPMALHRAAKAFLREAHLYAEVLWNRVDARHEASLRWLRALGFRIHPARPCGPAELPFHLVTREA